MADPFTISMALAAGGAAVGAVGKYQEGKANSAMYGYQQGVAKINQQIQKQNADYARATGEVEAQTSGMKTRQQVGGIVAAQSGSGLAIGKGSAGQVVQSQEDVGEHDQAIIRSNAAKRAYGFEVEATQAEAQANIYGAAAKQSRTAGILGGISSIIGGATSVAGKWADASRVGAM